MANPKGLTGAGNDIAHQTIIAELLYLFMDKTKSTNKYRNYKILPELPLDKYIPDMTVFKVSRHKYIPQVVVEVTKTHSFKKDIEKCQKIIQDYNSIDEAFVIVSNLDEPSIYKIRRLASGKPSQIKKDSFCDCFKIDLLKVI